MRGRLLGGMVAVAALAFAGCGSDSEDSGGSGSTASKGESKPVKMAVVHYANTDVTAAEMEGFKQALAPEGGTATLFNANFDAQKQLQQCQDAVTSRRYNVIVLAAVDRGTGVPCVTAAKSAGIPVITFETPTGKSVEDINPQVPGVVGSLNHPPSTYGEAMGQITKEACADRDPCKILAEIATPNDIFSAAQLEGIKAQVPGAQILQKFAGNYDPAQVTKQLPAVLAAHPDADVLVTSSDSQALAAVPVLKQTGLLGKVKIIGAAATRRGVAAVKDGTMFGTIGQFPTTTAKVAAKMAIQAVNGEPVDPKGVDGFDVASPLILTKDTVQGFEAEYGPAPEAE